MRILHNARIHTLDKSQPLASAILIDHGDVVAVGGQELLGEVEHGERQDLRGRVILPGLTDAHLHLKSYALALRMIDCETDGIEQCLQRVRERAIGAAAGEWILGHGWNQNTWGQWPCAADLDRAAPNNPVYLTAKSLHAAWVNSAALRLAHMTTETADPKDGQIQRTVTGEPTGILLENAMLVIDNLVPEPDLKDLIAAMKDAQSILWKFGLTGAHDFDGRDSFMALQELDAQRLLKLRVTKSIPLDSLQQASDLGLRTGFGNDWLRIGGVKVFMDGALGPRTAAMFQAYAGEPENKGILNLDGEQLFEFGRRAADAGLGMAVHAIGDRANHEVLNAYQQLRAYESENGLPHLRHRIEHVQLLHADDKERLASLNVIASMQPMHATSDLLMADKFWGERTSLAYAPKTQLDLGAHVAFGSDAPVESPNPFLGIHAAVTRRRADGSPGADGWHPEQRLTVEEAIEGFTTGPAYAAYAETRQGRLAAGSLADLIVLEKDPFTCDPDELGTLRPLATMVGGEWVWQS
jgi:predicted amidohydrolase YtcJ